jgi:two-component system, chemotaxis family, CheB/CheR fusion protein
LVLDNGTLDMGDKESSEFNGPLTSTLKLPRYVVGIGASAGGLESLEKLFRNLPANTGMAFVVLQHLSPDFKSMMYELLGRDTTMTIQRVEDGMAVAANTVYLLPPKKLMVIEGDRLHLSDKDPQKGLALPIDHFLESLARNWGERAIAVILSGSGSDGSRGVVEIAREGGFVITESLETAKFDGMPASAQASGVVDETLAPEEMGELLVNLVTQPETTRAERRELGVQRTDALQGMDAIYQLFRTVHDIDFSIYKDSTVLRRVQRRVAMTGATSLDAYARQLLNDRKELDALYCDLLIGVTQFFRDPLAYTKLRENVFPTLIGEKQPDDLIRAWVAGCASGEEAYSLAIAVHETCEELGRPFRLKLFATDLHRASLEQAGRGAFSPEMLKCISPERRERYFHEKDGQYLISPEIRKSIVFAPHNILSDAPFTDLDFVSCRNMLIYFQAVAQRRVLSRLHYALNKGGILWLGGSESPGEISSEFEPLFERERIYQKLRDVRLPNEFRAPPLRPRTALHVSPARTQAASAAFHERQALHEQLLNHFMPPGLLIDGDRSLIETFGGAEKLLSFPAREPSLDILELVDRGLRSALSGAIHRAMKENTPVRFSNVKLQCEGHERAFNLTLTPLATVAPGSQHYFIGLEPLPSLDPRDQLSDVAAQPMEPAPGEITASRTQIRQLEDDLKNSRENLQATIEELETSNEELQATNEELIASNEELQSTNEELHSVNEELFTVNAEHQRKISELAELNQDMYHLLENTDVATVFLDRELCIRRFTSRVQTLFDLLEHDVGRPIHSFLPKFAVDDLLGRLRHVLASGESFECETLAQDGTCYLLRLLPYRIQGTITGVVLMLVDVSSLEVLRERLRWMSAIVESTDDAIIGQDLAGRIVSWNVGAERLYGYSAAEAIGRNISMIIPPGQRDEAEAFSSGSPHVERPYATDTIRLTKAGREINVSLTISPVKDRLDRTIGVSKIARDISQRIAMEEEIRQQVRQREAFLATLSHELRNPLGAVLNATRIIRDDRADQEMQRKAAEIIERQVSMTRTLLVDLLDVSRIAQGKIGLKLAPVALTSLIQLVKETTQSAISRHQNQLEFMVEDSGLTVLGDSTRLIQVQVNLIHNAAKYSPPGSTIQVKLERDGQQALISVTDEGKGIPAAELTRIFDPFVQIGEAKDQWDGGLGVGLTLVKTLVEMHGGRVEADSGGPDQGSVFRVWLPLAQQAALQPELSANPGSTDEEPKQVSSQPCRVVLIEDLADSRQMLQSLLEIEGHTVLTAVDGESGYELVLAERPNVAVVDIGLPGMDGHAVARRVRLAAGGDSIKLVALTGYGQQGDIAKSLESGFDAHLTKPVDPDQLMRLIQEITSSRHHNAKAVE